MPKQSLLKRITASKSFLLLGLTVVVLIITYIVKPVSFNMGNTRQVLANLTYAGFFGIGVACLLISGNIDFSLAAQGTACMLIFGTFLAKFPSVPWGVWCLVAVVVALIMGGINAFFTNKLNLMSFIATIGMSSVWSGLGNWYTRTTPVTIRNNSFNGLASKYVFGSPIPWLFVLMLLFFVLYSLMLMRTKFGRSILMTGGNATAARLAGLKPKRISSILFLNASFLSAIGGLIWAAQQKMASPAGLVTAAPDMTGLTASILGGVAFAGGAGSLGGAFSGIVLIQVLAYCLQVMGLPTWIITFINGSLLVIALTIDTFGMKRRMKKLGIKMSASGMVMPGVK
jgi:ribose transport system permease protein